MPRPLLAFAPAAQCLGHRLGTGIVEAHPIDQRAVRHGTKHSRRVIACLRMARYSAQLGKAESESLPHRHGGGGFVHSGGEPDGIGEFQPSQSHR